LIKKQQKEIKMNKNNIRTPQNHCYSIGFRTNPGMPCFANLRTSTYPAGFERFKKNEKVKSNAIAVRGGVLLKFATGAWFYIILWLRKKTSFGRTKLHAHRN